MSINWEDFWEYYDPSIQEHREAIEMLRKWIPAEQLTDDAPWVLKYRSHVKEKRSPASDSIRTGLVLPIDWFNTNAKVSRYFTVMEVTKGDYRRIPPQNSIEESNILKLAEHLDKLRESWGGPIGVISWYRPPDVNREVGGVSNSMHIQGLAADIYTLDGADRKFENWLDARWQGGLGYGVRNGLGFTHVDLGAYRRWDY